MWHSNRTRSTVIDTGTADLLRRRLARIEARAEHMDKAWQEEMAQRAPEQRPPAGSWVQQTDGSWRREERLD